ncbi:L-rhamnose mutarotase [Paraburkholderia susongensis]|uniref:L-rhamnose mutarotase n=1 Tax=Paraburkholderia susongensis TaxID=1515439 RepID=A0A1X7LVL8_9BURK|nr:L-rhamnose mutarotase [Paraburkholderia susongensis]SMG57921.1 L-rhamnose mutarotase [Paraburkholderia susongensis]
MQKMAMVVGIHAEKIAEYKQLHAEVWPEVLARIRQSNIRNYAIFLREPENLLFGYWEYVGHDFAADMAAMAADPATQRWWALTAPCQARLSSARDGEQWAMMEQVFNFDAQA